MNLRFFSSIDRAGYRPVLAALEIFRYIGPGLLVTVGFIDPGNWAANIAAGAGFGYRLLWMVSLSTLMLIVLQHNVAHLGIATGLCLSEAATTHTPRLVSRGILCSAMLASISTSLAEIMGGAIALNMLFHIPIVPGALLMIAIVAVLLFNNSYTIVEKIIVGFVSIIGLSFLYELTLVDIDWPAAATGWVTPTLPPGSIMIVMSVLGAVVMPHNLFLHSEIIQSRQWNLEDDKVITRQLDYEFMDTLLSMGVGWAINSAMILLAAATFFKAGRPVHELQQAQALLTPLVQRHASVIFAIALLLAGIASTVTSAMAGGTIFAGMYNEPYDLRDNHTRLGVAISLLGALAGILLVSDPFRALILSQMLLSIQLPFTIFLQIYLTASSKVMGRYVNSPATTWMLLGIGMVVTLLNGLLLQSFL